MMQGVQAFFPQLFALSATSILQEEMLEQA
jgi:hypothetical protein